MHVIRRRGWEIPEHQATPEGVYLNRRSFMNAAADCALALDGSTVAPRPATRRVSSRLRRRVDRLMSPSEDRRGGCVSQSGKSLCI